MLFHFCFFFVSMFISWIIFFTVSTLGQLQPVVPTTQSDHPPPTSVPTPCSTTTTSSNTNNNSNSQLQARLSQPPLSSSSTSNPAIPPEGTREQLRYLLQRDKTESTSASASSSSTSASTTTAARLWVPGADSCSFEQLQMMTKLNKIPLFYPPFSLAVEANSHPVKNTYQTKIVRGLDLNFCMPFNLRMSTRTRH